MWKQAVEKAKSTDADKVIAAHGRPDLQGAQRHARPRWMRRTTTCTKPVFIGEIKADGQFNVVWKTAGPVAAQRRGRPYIAGIARTWIGRLGCR
jgi:urea transport system substrate-binding protein